MNELQDILQEFCEEYFTRYSLPLHHFKAIHPAVTFAKKL